ncbi:Pol protein [Phytophthora palmivora]|uniref:Pol protein n=1 Tax=Phytophthora palmivora TaxID=4796 RepID=A0A2P4YBL7_9STRA|nr:Pol protein [Phytophthora palmivora]
MDATLVSTERLWVAFVLSNLGGRAKTWAYTREATTPGWFTTWAQLCQQVRAAFLPANYEYRQHSHFLACKQGKRELHEYIQEMRVLAASLARTPTSVWQSHNASSGAVEEVPAAGASTGPVPMELGTAVQSSIRCYGCGKLGYMQRACPAGEKRKFPSKPRGSRGPRSAVSDRALVRNVPTSVRDSGTREGRQSAYTSEEVLGVTNSNEDVAISLSTGHETKAHCQACGIATTASSNAESRRAVWASTMAVLDGTDQAGNKGPQADNVVPQTTEVVDEDAERASGVGVTVPRGVKKTNTRAEHPPHKAPQSGSETPSARPVEEQYHVFDGVSGRQVKAGAVHLETLPEVSALLNLEELSMKDFLADLKAGEIAEMVLLKPETSPEDLNPSVMDEDVLEGFTKQRATRLGSEILKNPEDPVYPLVKEYSDVWPLPREQCEVIDAFFAEKVKSAMVRKSKSPHSTPTFCVRKPNGKWRLVHAYNKLNNATVQAQTPIPRKDVLLNNTSGCTLYSALDLVDGYYQILMRESDIPLTAVSTPSGMLWEWLDAFEFPNDVQSLGHTTWLGLANYLHKYSAGYAELARPLSDLLKKDADWVWEQQHQDAFDSIKASLQHVPVLALPDDNKSFSVVCDASDYAIGCALLQKDDEGRERVISFQSRQLKAAERNYPVHDKELLAMKYALVKFRVHLLGTRPFVIYTDHASLRTVTNSPHLLQRMARWLSFFAEYNFRVEYKPGKLACRCIVAPT